MTLWCYLDDLIMLGGSWTETFYHTLELLRLLLKVGLEINYRKWVRKTNATSGVDSFRAQFCTGRNTVSLG